MHLSLGPSCLSSGILKSANLRRFSLPLDWAQSGSNQLLDLFSLQPSEYYYHHIYKPSYPFEQCHAPDSSNSHTAAIRPVKPLYGFPYFYNPHKTLSAEKEYFIRCLRRFQDLRDATIGDDLVVQVLLSDHIDISAENYFPCPEAAALFVENAFSATPWNFFITICRVARTKDHIISFASSDITSRARICKVLVPAALGSQGYENMIARGLYPGCTRSEYQARLITIYDFDRRL